MRMPTAITTLLVVLLSYLPCLAMQPEPITITNSGSHAIWVLIYNTQKPPTMLIKITGNLDTVAIDNSSKQLFKMVIDHVQTTYTIKPYKKIAIPFNPENGLCIVDDSQQFNIQELKAAQPTEHYRYHKGKCTLVQKDEDTGVNTPSLMRRLSNLFCTRNTD